MLKCLFIALGMLYCSSVFANETVFHCETEQGNIISVTDKIDTYEYSISNKGKSSKGFSFETPVGELREHREKYRGAEINILRMRNDGYTYMITSLQIEDVIVPFLVTAHDPDDKIVSEQKCKDAESEIKAYSKAVKESRQEKNTSITDGMYRVGIDIPEGEYRLVANSESASFTIYKDSSRSKESLIAVEMFENNTFITVKDGQYLDLKRCAAEKVR